MTVPLQVEGRSIGVFHIQDKLSGDYTGEDLELLQLMAPTLAVLIMSAAMLRELRDHRRRLEAALAERQLQLEKAAQIQRSLLPHVIPTLEGYELAAACMPADEVAGDFYDWMLSPGGRLTITVADVMGKGVPASLVMASLRAALRAAPADIGPAVRTRLAEDSMALGMEADPFVTVFHADLDLASGVLRYVDAGHGLCAVRRPDGRLLTLTEHAMPLGVVAAQKYREATLRLHPGDALIVFSDGLVEQEGRTGDLSDFDAELSAAPSAAGMVERLLARMPEHLADDVTLLVLRRLPRSAPES
jgi:serine phosphatase RsbU (regulator of sigma subunit)